MIAEEYKESYFESPDDLDLALGDFLDYAAARVSSVLTADFRGAKLAHSSTHALQHCSRSMGGVSSVL